MRRFLTEISEHCCSDDTNNEAQLLSSCTVEHRLTCFKPISGNLSDLLLTGPAAGTSGRLISCWSLHSSISYRVRGCWLQEKISVFVHLAFQQGAVVANPPEMCFKSKLNNTSASVLVKLTVRGCEVCKWIKKLNKRKHFTHQISTTLYFTDRLNLFLVLQSEI